MTTSTRRATWATAIAVMLAIGITAAATRGAAIETEPITDPATATTPVFRLPDDTSPDPSPQPPTGQLPGRVVTVDHIIDGDTIDVGLDENVRMLGYDTPERGECGFVEATEALRTILVSGTVTVLADGDDTDQYDRYLRHVYVNGIPVGITLIEQGRANARYDSLDGYGSHLHQDAYRAADGPHNCGPTAD